MISQTLKLYQVVRTVMTLIASPGPVTLSNNDLKTSVDPRLTELLLHDRPKRSVHVKQSIQTSGKGLDHIDHVRQTSNVLPVNRAQISVEAQWVELPEVTARNSSFNITRYTQLKRRQQNIKLGDDRLVYLTGAHTRQSARTNVVYG
ncbi:hypothetical protein TKK_0012067 [Trichogramma kaykai]